MNEAADRPEQSPEPGQRRAGPGTMTRMPTGFGPSPGPRQHPAGGAWPRGDSGPRRQTVLRTSFETEPAALAALLPRHFTLSGPPTISISASYLEDIGWLAGRGYNIMSVDVPVTHVGPDGTVHATSTLVVWESLADPIITGREELGIAKLYADIPALVLEGSRAVATAGWLGYEFLRLEVSDLVDRPAPPVVATGPVLHHKYIPRTGEWGAADVDYVTMTSGRPVEILERRIGSAAVSIADATWEDLPTLHHIVSRLRALPVLSVGKGSLVVSKMDFDGRDQTIVP
ncbi:MAG: hypothetical protein JWN62_229 [Acidimicrobiales bacterium]|nr:hypothetical protein [Acidimicrobiales bacterium]